MYAILPKDYPLKQTGSFDLHEFAGLEFLMPYGRFDIDIKAVLDPLGIRLSAKPCRMDDETVIRMVSRGLGVTMMTELMVRGRTTDVLCVPVHPQCTRELGMGTHIRRSPSASIQKLKDCMVQYIHEHG